MSFWEWIALFTALAAITAVISFLTRFICTGRRYVGPTLIPIQGIRNVRIVSIECDAFTIAFNTIDPLLEAVASIDLSPWSDPTDNGIRISAGPTIIQTLTAFYSTPQTDHTFRLSNGGFGLQRGANYKFFPGGRGGDDNGSGFYCKTRRCCLGPFLERRAELIREITEWRQEAGR